MEGCGYAGQGFIERETAMGGYYRLNEVACRS